MCSEMYIPVHPFHTHDTCDIIRLYISESNVEIVEAFFFLLQCLVSSHVMSNGIYWCTGMYISLHTVFTSIKTVHA